MGVRDLFSHYDSKFVSVRDLVTGIAYHEQVSLSEAARAICPALEKAKTRGVYRSQPAGEYIIHRINAPMILPNLIIENNSFEKSTGREWPGYYYSESDACRYGWFKDEITPILKNIEIPIKSHLTGNDIAPKPSLYPENETIGDAAYNELLRYKESLREWCNRYDFEWPVPLPTNSPIAPSENTAMAKEQESENQKIDELTEENSRLTEECEQLRKQLKQALKNKPRGELAGKLEQAIAEYPAKRESIKTRPLTLDGDIRPWTVERFKISGKDAHVIGKMVAQHFNVDTENGEADTQPDTPT